MTKGNVLLVLKTYAFIYHLGGQDAKFWKHCRLNPDENELEVTRRDRGT